MTKLGVNIDHVATLRETRRIDYPDPIEAARLAEKAGADAIVVHLREDRRHIKEEDVRRLRAMVKTKFNLEMSINKEIVEIAKSIKPDQSTLVPERREELTTEGGLDVVSYFDKTKKVVADLKNSGIIVSLFVDPDKKQIKAARQTGAEAIEIHTGEYANVKDESQRGRQISKIEEASREAARYGLNVFAGHGLNYDNVRPIAEIETIEELNIGHSIISRAVFIGLVEAIREIKELIGR
jgi:pyridoxine 5-phosphate synthase